MLARLFSYFLPVDSGPPLRDHRKENRERANELYVEQLVEDEIAHWRSVAKEQPARYDEAMDRLDEIRIMRTCS